MNCFVVAKVYGAAAANSARLGEKGPEQEKLNMLMIHSKNDARAEVERKGDRLQARAPIVHVLDDFADQAAQMLAHAIFTCIQEKQECRLGLAGGSTPQPVYARLRELLPVRAYEKLKVTWTDERVLPVKQPDGEEEVPGNWKLFDADSNLRMAYESWLAHVPLRHDQVLPLALSDNAKQELLRFGRKFQQDFRGGLDIALVGTGSDGHIASLFPGHPATEVDDIAVAIHDSPKAPAERISLTGPAICRAEKLVLLATGKQKAQVLKAAYDGDETTPLGRIASHPHGFWLLDREAARDILRSEVADR